MMRMIARIDAARWQIDRAITAYFEDDLVSALTLAGAAERVLSDLQRQDGFFGVDTYSWRSVINLYIKSEHQKEAAKIFRKDYDQLRHADYSKSETIEINKKMVDQYIFMAVLALNFLTKSMTKSMSIYQLWYTLHHPHLIKKGTEFAAKLERAGPVPEGTTKQEFYRMGQAFFPNDP